MRVGDMGLQYVVNSSEMQRADQNTISLFGMPQLVLMERAALSAEEMIRETWPELFGERARILLALGNGNNGGDGAALARLFYLQGHRVTVLVSGNEEKYSSALRKQMEILDRYRVAAASGKASLTVLTDEAWLQRGRRDEPSYDLVVDALFGIGLSRQVSGIYGEKIDWLNGLSGKKAALDIPSGVSAQDGSILGTAFRADLTVTFGFIKTGMLLYPGKGLCGQSRVADIGIAPESFLQDYPAGVTLDKNPWEGGGIFAAKCRGFQRRQDGHKGSFGKVLLFAGSVKTPGAALLAGEAVLRSGAGMLRLVSPKENREPVLTKLPEAMYEEFGSDTDWEGMLAWCDAVVAGPGIGTGPMAEESLGKILSVLSEKYREKPLILDADGLNLAASSAELQQKIKDHTALGGILVMTPHMAEFARLLHCGVKDLQAERMERAERFVRESGVILVSKDAATIVCYADERQKFRYYLNQTGNNGMATAGSGDVLSGMAGALAAFTAVRLRERRERMEEESRDCKAAYFETAYSAVYLHGAAGDRAAKKYGKISMKAGDIVLMLPELFTP